jgi:hypothetical protein
MKKSMLMIGLASLALSSSAAFAAGDKDAAVAVALPKPARRQGPGGILPAEFDGLRH